MVSLFADYLISANAILALVLCITTAFHLVAMWHHTQFEARFEADRKITWFILLIALVSFSVSAIAFLLMYYMISSDVRVMTMAGIALSVAIMALFVVFNYAFKRNASVYLDESGRMFCVGCEKTPRNKKHKRIKIGKPR